jgi:cation-transporting P-type ATPase E
MTGDGVNDVLAIKDSDLGVAMGSGAAATRSVAQIVLLNDDFATLPHVVAEGRRVIGNIERVANFFLTKTMYSIVLALLVAVARLPFPFVPMHISFIGWYTIGIPAAILALAPNSERARAGFLKRVLSFSMPVGLVIGVTAFLTYWVCLKSVTDEVTATQASTATVIAVMVAGGWAMIAIARPYQWWKIGMIATMIVLAALTVFWLPGWYAQMLPTWPWLATANPQLDPTNVAMNTTAVWFGLGAAVLVEAMWWISGRVTGLHRRVFGSLADN